MPWKIQPIRGQDYRCIFCCMQRVICNGSIPLYFPVITCAQQLSGVHLRTSQKPVQKFSGDFRTLSKISEDFPKILKNHKNIWKLLLNRFRSFPKIPKDFWTLPKISKDFPKILKNHKNI